MSWFSAAAPTGPVIHPVQLRYGQEALFGPLVKEDTTWLTAGGFITETQTFYATTKAGALIMCQVIHSSVGVWYPSIQFTFRFVDRTTDTHVWKSTTVTNFLPGPSPAAPSLDKRSSRSDQFTITLDPASPGRYVIEGTYDEEVSISLVYERLAEGWKLGAGPQGGMTYFGQLGTAVAKGEAPDVAAGGDGYAVHRFWPRCSVEGYLTIKGEKVDVVGARGIFIHAVQGMRPNVLAANWNFANFQSSEEEGIALTMMEFTTTPAYGSQTINVGSVVVGDKLVAITVGGNGVEGGSTAEHVDTVIDVETDYPAPGKVNYAWDGTTLSPTGTVVEGAPRTSAALSVDLLTSSGDEAYATRGLVEKVDVLAQVPYLVRKFVNYAAGTKPYIYTWLNPVKASVTTGDKTIDIEGHLFSEATFISSEA